MVFWCPAPGVTCRGRAPAPGAAPGDLARLAAAPGKGPQDLGHEIRGFGIGAACGEQAHRRWRITICGVQIGSENVIPDDQGAAKIVDGMLRLESPSDWATVEVTRHENSWPDGLAVNMRFFPEKYDRVADSERMLLDFSIG